MPGVIDKIEHRDDSDAEDKDIEYSVEESKSDNEIYMIILIYRLF